MFLWQGVESRVPLGRGYGQRSMDRGYTGGVHGCQGDEKLTGKRISEGDEELRRAYRKRISGTTTSLSGKNFEGDEKNRKRIFRGDQKLVRETNVGDTNVRYGKIGAD